MKSASPKAFILKTIESSYYDPEYIQIVEEILDHRDFQNMDSWIQHISTRRLSHCINVSFISYKIAKFLHVDAASCARAGLLHDFCLYDFHDASHKHTKQLFVHPRVAAETARKRFNLSDKETRAILTHMFPFGPVPTSWTGWIVQLADKICAAGEFASGVKDLFKVKILKNKKASENLAEYFKRKHEKKTRRIQDGRN